MNSVYNIFFLSLKILFVFTNSIDPIEMPHYVAFHMGLNCLQEPVHKILVLIACVNNGRSDEPAHAHSLVRAFTSRPIRKLNCVFS